MRYDCYNTIEDIILEGPPKYNSFDLFAWDEDPCKDDAELVYVGSIANYYEEYKHYYISYIDEEVDEMWLAGTLEELQYRG